MVQVSMDRSGIIFSVRTHPVSSRTKWFRCMFGNLLYVYTFHKVFVFHWMPCSGPSRVFWCPPWRPPRKNCTDSPDFEFSYHNLMPFIYGQRFCSWTTDNSCPQEFQVRGSNQDIYGQPMVSLWSAWCHTYPCLIHRWVERPSSGRSYAPLISMVP
jgi:hypothetical protein